MKLSGKKDTTPVSPAYPQGDTASFKDGEVRTIPLLVFNAQPATTKNGKEYLKLWTNYGYVSAWKNTMHHFTNVEIQWFKVDLSCSVFNQTKYFSLAHVDQPLTLPRQPYTGPLTYV